MSEKRDLASLHEVLQQASAELNKDQPLRQPEKVIPLSSQVSMAALDDIKGGADRFRSIIDKAIKESSSHVTDDLNKLIKEIENIRDRAIERAAFAKAAIVEHFEWGTEAALFAETIRTRMAMFDASPQERAALA